MHRYDQLAPTPLPTPLPTPFPTYRPTPLPTLPPTPSPTTHPTPSPSANPTPAPTPSPTPFWQCPRGWFNEENAGAYSGSEDAFDSGCSQCRAGTYTNSSGNANCVACPDGTTNFQNGSITCYVCPTGRWGTGGKCDEICLSFCDPDGVVKKGNSWKRAEAAAALSAKAAVEVGVLEASPATEMTCLPATPSVGLQADWEAIGLGDEYTDYFDTFGQADSSYATNTRETAEGWDYDGTPEKGGPAAGGTCICQTLYGELTDCSEKQNLTISFIAGFALLVFALTVFGRATVGSGGRKAPQSRNNNNYAVGASSFQQNRFAATTKAFFTFQWASISRLALGAGDLIERGVLQGQHRDRVVSTCVTDVHILSVRELRIVCEHLPITSKDSETTLEEIATSLEVQEHNNGGIATEWERPAFVMNPPTARQRVATSLRAIRRKTMRIIRGGDGGQGGGRGGAPGSPESATGSEEEAKAAGSFQEPEEARTAKSLLDKSTAPENQQTPSGGSSMFALLSGRSGRVFPGNEKTEVFVGGKALKLWHEEIVGDRNVNSGGFVGKTEIRRIFEWFDEDKDGVISLSEFQNAITKLGLSRTEDECKMMLARIDDDENKEISCDEFLAMMQDMTTVKKGYEPIWQIAQRAMRDEKYRPRYLKLGDGVAKVAAYAIDDSQKGVPRFGFSREDVDSSTDISMTPVLGLRNRTWCSETSSESFRFVDCARLQFFVPWVGRNRRILAGQRLLAFGDAKSDVWPRSRRDVERWLGAQDAEKPVRCTFTPLELGPLDYAKLVRPFFWECIWDERRPYVLERFLLFVFIRAMRVLGFGLGVIVGCALVVLEYLPGAMGKVSSYLGHFGKILLNSYFILHSFNNIGLDALPFVPEIRSLYKGMSLTLKQFLDQWEFAIHWSLNINISLKWVAEAWDALIGEIQRFAERLSQLIETAEVSCVGAQVRPKCLSTSTSADS